MATDIERLHSIHEALSAGYSLPRRSGRTWYACHELCGILLANEYETIMMMFCLMQRRNHFMSTLEQVLPEYNLIVDRKKTSSQFLFFSNNTNKVKFTSIDLLPHDLRGYDKPFLVEDLD